MTRNAVVDANRERVAYLREAARASRQVAVEARHSADVLKWGAVAMGAFFVAMISNLLRFVSLTAQITALGIAVVLLVVALVGVVRTSRAHRSWKRAEDLR